MKIKTAILDTDIQYITRVSSAFGARYADKIELYSFTSIESVLSAMQQQGFDILLCNENIAFDLSKLPKYCSFAYLVGSLDIESKNGQSAICKYQAVDQIYKQILSIYSENADNNIGLKLDDNNTKVICFSSPCGGCGTSTFAAACATQLAAQGKKVLFLELQTFGGADLFFEAEGKYSMSDVIYSIKKQKVLLALKLESCTRQSPNGVYYFAQPRFALDMTELTGADCLKLITELCLVGTYDSIIVDLDFSLDNDMLKLFEQCAQIIWIADDSKRAALKLTQAFNALVTLSQKDNSHLAEKVAVAFNFSRSGNPHLNLPELRTIGNIPRLENATIQQVIDFVYKRNFFPI